MIKENKGLFIVIPAYNEENNIGKVIKKSGKYSKNVVVVDDGSRDKTYEAAMKNKVVVLRHIVNMGKGAALKTGCDYAYLKKAKKIIVLDADGQHDADEIPKFLERLKNNDVVFGCRAFNKNMPFVLKFGNWFINKTTKLLYGLDLKDTQSGFRAFSADIYKKIRWKSQSYEMESEMIARVGKNHLRYEEIPIQTIYLDSAKGTTILDGIRIVLKMIWWKLWY